MTPNGEENGKRAYPFIKDELAPLFSKIPV
jgi:hypothetical protein